MQNSIISLNRESNISPKDFYSNYVLPSKPVILEGLVDEWKAKKMWNLSFFKENYGQKIIPVTQCDKTNQIVEMRLLDYIKVLESKKIENKELYLRNWSFTKENPELLEYYHVPDHFNQNWLSYLSEEFLTPPRWILLGPKNTYTPLHQDVFMTHSWNALLIGKKQWFLFEPTHYIEKRGKIIRNPETKNEACYYAIQKPGDILFIPSGWWHHVKNKELSLALSENYVDHTNFENFLKVFSTKKSKRFYRKNLVLNR